MSILNANPAGRIVIVDGDSVSVMVRANLTYVELQKKLNCHTGLHEHCLFFEHFGESRRLYTFDGETTADNEVAVEIYKSIVAESVDVVWTAAQLDVERYALAVLDGGRPRRKLSWSRTPTLVEAGTQGLHSVEEVAHGIVEEMALQEARRSPLQNLNQLRGALGCSRSALEEALVHALARGWVERSASGAKYQLTDAGRAVSVSLTHLK